MEDYDEGDIQLPPDTLKILNQFLAEKAAKEKLEQDLIKSGNHSVEIEENWQLSQFWYNDKTKNDIAGFVQQFFQGNGRIALLSCPSLYKPIKSVNESTLIFEFDERFSVYGADFVHYDINLGGDESYLSHYKNSFDLIIADPPFLSEECIQNTAHIVKRLGVEDSKIIFCSGEVVEPWVKKYLGLTKQAYKPEHARNLGNEFVTYANFNLII